MYFFVRGAMVGGSLIMAIGAQNAFVLRQGLLRQHVGLVAAVCFMGDVLLMSIGVLGMGAIIQRQPLAATILALMGVMFLLAYGLRCFVRAWRKSSALVAAQGGGANVAGTAWPVLLSALMVTFLNPHAWLDTVVIMGGVATPLEQPQRLYFLAGALMASFCWFFSLAYGARLLAPLFRRPQTWRVLDVLMGVLMWWIACGLAFYAWRIWS